MVTASFEAAGRTASRGAADAAPVSAVDRARASYRGATEATPAVADGPPRVPGSSAFAYEGDPTIPPGVTCAEFRRAHPAPPQLAFLAHARAWLRYHQFGEVVR